MYKLAFLLLTFLFIKCGEDKNNNASLVYTAAVGERFTTYVELNKLKGIEVFNGDLWISCDEIKSLEMLESLTTINGNLELHDNRLETLSGLENLRKVNSISLSQNNHLKNIKALRKISEVKELNLSTNDKLISIAAFEALTITEGISITGTALREIGENITFKDSKVNDISILSNENLRSVSFLKGIKKAKRIWIVNNSKLTIGKSLNMLEIVDDFRIQNNASITFFETPRLMSINEYHIGENPKLTKIIGGNFWLNPGKKVAITIELNDKLQAIEGFNNLHRLELIVEANNSLQSIEGFNSVDSIKLQIEENPKLYKLDMFHKSAFTNYDIGIFNNASLYNYCGLNKLLVTNLPDATIDLKNNFYNPTKIKLLNGKCAR